MDFNSKPVARIQDLLGEQAARSFVPLFRKWVAAGLIGGHGFNEAGDEIVAAAVERAGMQPQHGILDIGCGLGRVALALLPYLGDSGSYAGFDPVISGVDWLRTHVTPKFPRFRFDSAEGIYSGLYNPAGDTGAHSFCFPYGEGIFDIAIAVSVFTHMEPPGVVRYLSEVHRTLRPGGKLLCTAYLINDLAVESLNADNAAIRFDHDRCDHKLRSASAPEDAVAFDETAFFRWAMDNSLVLKSPVRYGSWRDKDARVVYQDLIILGKPA